MKNQYLKTVGAILLVAATSRDAIANRYPSCLIRQTFIKAVIPEKDIPEQVRMCLLAHLETVAGKRVEIISVPNRAAAQEFVEMGLADVVPVRMDKLPGHPATLYIAVTSVGDADEHASHNVGRPVTKDTVLPAVLPVSSLDQGNAWKEVARLVVQRSPDIVQRQGDTGFLNQWTARALASVPDRSDAEPRLQHFHMIAVNCEAQ
jgi:hypothetical protein